MCRTIAHVRTSEPAHSRQRHARRLRRAHKRFGGLRIASDEITRLILAKEGGRAGDIYADTRARRFGHLEGRKGKPAIGDIRAGGDMSSVGADELTMGPLCGKVDLG